MLIIKNEILSELSQDQLDQYLIEASLIGDLEQVKYLLTGIKNQANIKGWDEEAFICACKSGNIPLIDYMLRSEQLKEHSNIHTKNDLVFKAACNEKNVELLNYFIFDYKIGLSDEISNFLVKNKLNKILKAFTLNNTNKLTLEDFPKKQEYKGRHSGFYRKFKQ